MNRRDQQMDKEKPPRRNPGGGECVPGWQSALDGVAAFSVGSLGGTDRETHLLAEDTRHKTPHRVGLPAGGFHEFLPAGAPGPPQQVENLGGLATLACSGGLFGRLRRHAGSVAFCGRGGLLPRPRPGLRNVRPVCANVGLFVGNRRLRRGRSGDIRRFFWDCVHDDSFFRGQYRDHRDHSAEPRMQANSHQKRRRCGDAVPMTAGSAR
jgi:hypothetical protein